MLVSAKNYDKAVEIAIQLQTALLLEIQMVNLDWDQLQIKFNTKKFLKLIEIGIEEGAT